VAELAARNRFLYCDGFADSGVADAQGISCSSKEKAFYSFEPDFFQQNLLRIVDDVVGVIKASIQLWPTIEFATAGVPPKRRSRRCKRGG
jgi:hypothetical protein